MYKIEKNIPITNKAGRKKSLLFPFDEMEVLDSFYVYLDENEYKDISSLRSTITKEISRYVKQNPDTKFKTSADETGIRVWRIK